MPPTIHAASTDSEGYTACGLSVVFKPADARSPRSPSPFTRRARKLLVATPDGAITCTRCAQIAPPRPAFDFPRPMGVVLAERARGAEA